MTNLYDKIEKIILISKDHIKKYFSNHEIFKLFRKSKRIILFLLKENILAMDKTIISTMIDGKMKDQKYPKYFSPELKPLLNEIDDKEDQKYLETIVSKKEKLVKMMTCYMKLSVKI